MSAVEVYPNDITPRTIKRGLNVSAIALTWQLLSHIILVAHFGKRFTSPFYAHFRLFSFHDVLDNRMVLSTPLTRR